MTISQKLRNLFFSCPENLGSAILDEPKPPTDANIREILGEAIIGESTTKADGIIVADGVTGKLKNSNTTILEILNLLIPEGTPVNATSATGILTAVSNPENDDTFTIGNTNYIFKTALTSPAVANEILIEVSAADTLNNLINAINGGAGAGTKYGTGTVVHPTVSASAGDGDTVNLVAKTKGTSGNIILTLTSNFNLELSEPTLTGGIDGTVGAKYDMYKDESYIYLAIAANTITDTNWRRIALGTAY